MATLSRDLYRVTVGYSGVLAAYGGGGLQTLVSFTCLALGQPCVGLGLARWFSIENTWESFKIPVLGP